jgi:site-specific DNA recombinase
MSEDLLIHYIRLSQEDENEGESNSIMNQRDLLKAFVERSPELSQYKSIEFCDDGYSGTNFDRPGVKALLEKVREGNVRCIIVKDLSRFGRNYIEVGDYLEQIFPFLGVRFIAVNDRFDSNDFDGTTGGIDVGFRNLIYSLYSKDLSQKVRSGKKTRMEKGEFISSHAPYGYMKSPENRRKLIVDEEAAAVVRRIFAMADEGKNSVQIASALNAESVPTPSAYKRLKGCERKYRVVGESNYWLNSTVITIIHDQRYTGKMVNGKNRNPHVGCKHGKRTPKSEWVIVPNTHEAIVSEEMFASIQDRFSAPVKTKKEQAEVRPLLGKVKCGVCHHAMRRSDSPPATAYYCCVSHKCADDSPCTKDRISESSLTQTVLSAMHTQVQVMLDIERLLNRLKSQGQSATTKLTEQIRQHQAVLARLKASKIEAYEKYRDGALDRENHAKLKADIGRQIDETGAQIAELEIKLQSSYQGYGQPCSIIESFKRYENFTELSKEMVDELIDSIYIYGNDSVEIVWNYTDEYLRLVQSIEKECVK